MTLLQDYPNSTHLIEKSTILSNGQKLILNVLLRLDSGVAMSHIMLLTNSSKQSLHFNMKKLLGKGYVKREREMVFLYKLNKNKVLELLKMEEELTNYKK